MGETAVRFEWQEPCGCVVHEEGWKHVRKVWTKFCAQHDREEMCGEFDTQWTVNRATVDAHDRLVHHDDSMDWII